MLRHAFRLRCASATTTTPKVLESLDLARTCLASQETQEALQHLDQVKKLAPNTENADLLRALAFSQRSSGIEDLFAARQSILEELRHHPRNEEAHDFFESAIKSNRTLQSCFSASSSLSSEVRKSEPVFSMAYSALVDHTMLDAERLLSLFQNTRFALQEFKARSTTTTRTKRPVIVECGVAGGGSLAMMGISAQHTIAQVNNKSNKVDNKIMMMMKMPKLIAFDTFSGMPAPSSLDQTVHSSSSLTQNNTNDDNSQHWLDGTCCSGSEFQVKHLCRAFSLFEEDENNAKRDLVETVPGLFQDTLDSYFSQLEQKHKEDGEKEAVEDLEIVMLHIDCDWYESTKQVLHSLWPRLPVGAKFQIDDFLYWKGCQKAVEEFFNSLEQKPKCSIAGVALVGTKL